MPESYISWCVPATERSCSGSVRFPQMKSQAEASALLIRNYLCCWHQLRFISILFYFYCNCSPTPTRVAVAASGAAHAGTNGAGNARGGEGRCWGWIPAIMSAPLLRSTDPCVLPRCCAGRLVPLSHRSFIKVHGAHRMLRHACARQDLSSNLSLCHHAGWGGLAIAHYFVSLQPLVPQQGNLSL